MCDLLKVRVLGHDTHTLTHPQTKRVPEREKKKAPLEKAFLWLKSSALSLFVHARKLPAQAGNPYVIYTNGLLFTERRVIGQHNNGTVCVNATRRK